MTARQIPERGGQPTILLVEDADPVRAGLHEWLGILIPGCRVLEARSGEEAVAIASSRPLDLVLMDVGLPGMSGIEAARQIKQIAPRVRVLVLSIHEDPSHQADAAAAGAEAYVFKRRMAADLPPALRALLGAIVEG